MTHYSYAQLEGLWEQAGGSHILAPIMAAIAEAESGGNSDATGKVGEKGLWQINPNVWGSWATYDPFGNAQAAVHVLGAQGLSAWSTYNSGKYLKYLKGRTPPTAVPVNVKASTNATLTSFNPLNPVDWFKSLLGIGGSAGFKDALERFGLIVFGGALILVGIIMLTGKGAISIAFPETQPVRRTEAFRRSEIHHYTHKDAEE